MVFDAFLTSFWTLSSFLIVCNYMYSLPFGWPWYYHLMLLSCCLVKQCISKRILSEYLCCESQLIFKTAKRKEEGVFNITHSASTPKYLHWFHWKQTERKYPRSSFRFVHFSQINPHPYGTRVGQLWLDHGLWSISVNKNTNSAVIQGPWAFWVFFLLNIGSEMKIHFRFFYRMFKFAKKCSFIKFDYQFYCGTCAC